MDITSIKYSKILITALVVFCMVKAINGISKKLVKTEDDGAEPTTKQCPFCKSEIAIDAVKCSHCTSDLL